MTLSDSVCTCVWVSAVVMFRASVKAVNLQQQRKQQQQQHQHNSTTSSSPSSSQTARNNNDSGIYMGEDSPTSRPPPTTPAMTTPHVPQQSMTSLRGSVERLDVNANDSGSVIRCDETYPGQEAWSKKDLKAAKRYGKMQR